MIAKNWNDFRDALKLWVVPSQNFIFADILGNIGKKNWIIIN